MNRISNGSIYTDLTRNGIDIIKSSTNGLFINGIQFSDNGVLKNGAISNDGLYFSASLTRDLNLRIGKGVVTHARASGQYLADFENSLVKANTNEAAFPGMRRVENLLTYSEDFSNADWAFWGAATGAGGIADPDGGTGAIRIDMPAASTGFHHIDTPTNIGKDYGVSIYLKSDISGLLRVFDGVGGGFDATLSITTEWRRYFLSGIKSLNSVTQFGVYRNTLAQLSSVYMYHPQMGDVTGLTNKVGEHVPTTTAPAAKYFNYQNPYTVDANGVVTDSGVRTPITTGAGVLLEPGSTNICTCYGVPRADDYATALIAAATMPKGKIFEIVTRVTLDFGTIGTLLSGTANTAGAKYLITGVAVLGTGDSAKECLDYVGTKAYHDGTVFQNPIPSMTLGGDVGAVLSIVTDQTAIDAAKLAGITNGYKVYSLVTGVGGAGNVDISGAMSAVITSLSCYARVISGSCVIGDNAGLNTVVPSGAVFVRYKKENFTATAAGTLRITAAASSSIIFIVPCVEELPYATSIMPTLGATATRAVPSLTYPVAGNFPTSGVRHVQLSWRPKGLVTGLMQCLWASKLDASNYVGIFVNGSTSVYHEKMVAGVSEKATLTITPVVGSDYLVDAYINADNTLQLKVDGVAAGTNTSTTLAPVLGTTCEVGGLGTANRMFGQVKLLKSFNV